MKMKIVKAMGGVATVVFQNSHFMQTVPKEPHIHLRFSWCSSTKKT